MTAPRWAQGMVRGGLRQVIRSGAKPFNASRLPAARDAPAA